MSLPTHHLLMIAFHYPPLQEGSGIHRTIGFEKHLPHHGWTPHILTAHPRAHKNSAKQLTEPAPHVHYALALDAANHLAWRGKYLKLFALPDRWASWWFSAIPQGLYLIKKIKPQVIWSTYPIATSHLIALTLHKLTGIPWIADFRDPMTDETHPYDPLTRRSYRWIERKTLNISQACIFTTQGTFKLYQQRYPHICQKNWQVIENGYEESHFPAQTDKRIETSRQSKTPIVLLHSGHVYPIERNPNVFLQTLAKLKASHHINNNQIKIIFRGIDPQHYLNKYIKELNLGDIVALKPSVPHEEAISEILNAHGLIILQANNCNHQIPAKAYEYLRANKPILALTDHQGDTANLLRPFNHCYIADLANGDEIEETLTQLINDIQNQTFLQTNSIPIKQLSRQYRTEAFANLLNRLTQNP